MPQHDQQFFHKMEELSSQYHFLATDKATIALADLSLLHDLHPDEKLPPLFTAQLSPSELATLATFTYKKRYTEWLGGRLAAKYCLELFLKKSNKQPLAPHAFTIRADTHGRPYLETAIHPLPSVSISHSKGYAAAYIAHTHSCGIDIQQITPKMETVTEKFTNHNEQALFHDPKNLLRNLTIIWAAKEAVKKSLLHDQSITFNATNVIAVENTGSTTWKLQCNITSPSPALATVTVAAFNDFIIGCTEGEPYA